MFDDLFSAAILATVGAVVAAGVWAGAAGFPDANPGRAVVAKGVSTDGTRTRLGARDALPVYDLPRVVVTGNRSRDGDQLAAESPTEIVRSTGR